MRNISVLTWPVAIIGGAFIGYFGHAFVLTPPVTSGDCGTWAGAVATFSASCVAIWLATREDRRRKASDRAAGLNAAISIKWSVNVLHHTLVQICTNLEKCSAKPNTNRDFFLQLGSELKEQPIWEFKGIERLVFWDSDVANRLAAAMDTAKNYAFMFSHRAHNSDSYGIDSRQKFARDSLIPLAKARNQLDSVLVEIKKIKSPEPEVTANIST